MEKYTLNLANTFYFIFSAALIIFIIQSAQVILAPVVFSFFLP